MKLIDAKNQVNQLGIERGVIVVVLNVLQHTVQLPQIFDARHASGVLNDPVMNGNRMLRVKIQGQISHGSAIFQPLEYRQKLGV